VISVAVMAHPDRRTMVLDLVGSIDTDVTVVWDEKSNEWDTGRRALLAADRDALYHVVLQDDALVCADLTAGLTHALTRAPRNAMVSLYIGAARPHRSRVSRAIERAAETGCSWVVMPALYWGVGLVFPAALIDEIVRVGDRTPVLEYDRRLSTVARKMRMPVWYTWPSLCDHLDGPSLLRHDVPHTRHAHRFEGTDWSALGAHWWDGPVLTIPSTGVQTPRRVSFQP
jgi:hypothetical protein